MELLYAKNAPATIGPYSHAVKTGNLLFLSGQVPFHPVTGEVVGTTMAEQARQTMANLKAVLDEAGLKPCNIAKTTVYISNCGLFSEFNEEYATFMGKHRPARVCVEIPNLPHGVFLEMDAIAVYE